jgi:hypothetical protein
MVRRLAGCLVLLAVLAAASASHHHAVLDLDSDTRSEEVVTTHDPFSNASHWHAILKILQVDPCLACHWSRFSAIPRSPAVSHVILAARKLNFLPPRSAISISRFTRRSRAPPALLSA